MPSSELADLIQNADSSAKQLVEVLASMSSVQLQNQAELNRLRDENAALKKKLRNAKSETRALYLVRDKLIAERAADKETIRMWQAQMNEAAPVPSELSTQESAAANSIPSSPPHAFALKTEPEANVDSQRGHAVESLSQRVLPMSIGIDDEDAGNQAEVEPMNHISSDTTDANVKLELGSSAINSDDSHCDSARPLSQPENYTKRRRTALSELNDAPELRHRKFLDNLQNREWHPADFKLNPDYKTGANLGVVRDKDRRNLLHGAECPDCSKFYRLSGIPGATQMCSRHRSALDKQNTPPGYWEMDFPESSQLSLERNEMHKSALNDGRQRLAEALAGGRYIFRDEQLNDQARELLRK